MKITEKGVKNMVKYIKTYGNLERIIGDILIQGGWLADCTPEEIIQFIRKVTRKILR